MIVFPNCKINLGLNIIGKRTDGYHDLETVFFPLPLYDVLEIIQPAQVQNDTTIKVTGIALNGNDEDNLCMKAYRLLKKDFPQIPAIKTWLHKTIPAGAGLGGGSADGAHMLLLINRKFNLNLTQQKLLDYALVLGSDCPFFILNKPCFAEKRGEVLEPVPLHLSGYKLVLINPGIHVNTGWAFSHVKYSAAGQIKKAIQTPLQQWQNNLLNDFEPVVFKKYPEIQDIKTYLSEKGALYTSMSGTGSSVYGIFTGDNKIDIDIFPANYFIKEMIL